MWAPSWCRRGAACRQARGRLRLRQHRFGEALADLTACGDGLVEAGCVNPGFAHWRSEAALAHLALGEHGTARDLADEELTPARRFGAARATGIALRMLGLIEGGSAGLDCLAESVEVLHGSTGRLELGHSLVAYGSALRRAGRRSDARLHLRQGLDLADRHHWQAVVASAREELQASGAKPRGNAQTGVDALTPSELRVARLGAAGNTNRAIAQALFITLRAVELHLTNVYRKLGIQSRDRLDSVLPR